MLFFLLIYFMGEVLRRNWWDLFVLFGTALFRFFLCFVMLFVRIEDDKWKMEREKKPWFLFKLLINFYFIYLITYIPGMIFLHVNFRKPSGQFSAIQFFQDVGASWVVSFNSVRFIPSIFKEFTKLRIQRFIIY